MYKNNKISSVLKPILKSSSRCFSNLGPYGIAYGLPGRSANSGITATVFGGYGFLGRYFIEELGNIKIIRSI